MVNNLKSNKGNKSNKSTKRNKSNSNTYLLNNNNSKNQKITPLLPVTSVTNVTFVTDIIRNKSIFDKLKLELYVNPGQTLKNISESKNIEYNILKTTVQRNKDSFIVIDKQGKEFVYDISEVERNNINFLVEQKRKQLEKEKEDKIKQDLEKRSDEDTVFKIKEIFNNIFIRNSNKLTLDLEKLKEQDPEIFDRLENNPDNTIELIKKVLEDKNLKESYSYSNLNQVQKRSLENLRADDIDKLFLIEAKSTSRSDVKAQTVRIKFECPSCGTIITVIQEGKFIREPKRCSCGRRGQFNVLSRFKEDYCKITLEDLESNSISIKNRPGILRGDLTSEDEICKVEPGNDLKVLGILRENPILINGKVTLLSDYFIEIYHIEPFEEIIDLNNFSEEELEQFKTLSNKINKDGLREIRNSFAPQIQGNDEIKDSLILQLSQPKNNFTDERRTKSNILLMGDPGTAKTPLIKFQEKISPLSRWAVGSTSTSVGLKATVEKIDDSWTLKPGAIVMAKEICFIDEFNNLNDDEKKTLQEAMFDKQITVDKATIHTKLKVSCGITASANPLYGKFDVNQDLISQFNLHAPIMDRFDFIFIVIDKVNYDNDMKIGKKVFAQEREKIKCLYDISFLKKFFLYIRSLDEPVFSDDIENYAIDLYAKMRQKKKTSGKITGRLLGVIIRTSKASARLRNSGIVEKKDIDLIFKLLNESYIKHLEENFT